MPNHHQKPLNAHRIEPRRHDEDLAPPGEPRVDSNTRCASRCVASIAQYSHAVMRLTNRITANTPRYNPNPDSHLETENKPRVTTPPTSPVPSTKTKAKAKPPVPTMRQPPAHGSLLGLQAHRTRDGSHRRDDEGAQVRGGVGELAILP